MADAGKIMIMPKGAYDASASYEVLDLVTHGDKAWIAKRNVTGVEPSEANSADWFLIVDSSKLGGKDASEYALSKNFYAGDTYSYMQSDSAISQDGYTYRLIAGNMGLKILRTNDNWETYETFLDLANYLPLSGGGTVNGNEKPITLNSTTTEYCLMGIKAKDTLLGSLGINATNEPVFVYPSGDVGKLLHTGNKPSGSYTGNGDATERTIVTGGTGHVAVVWNNADASSVMLITPYGAFGKQVDINKALDSSSCSFLNGTLTLKTDSYMLNGNGVIYSYQVL